MPERTYEYELTAPLWLRGQKAVIRRTRFFRWVDTLLIVMPLLFVGLSMFAGLSFLSALRHNLFVLILMPSLGLFGTKWLNKWQIRKTLGSNPAIGGRKSFALTEEGFSVKGDAGVCEVRWNAILRIAETPEFFLFYTLPRVAHFLPLESIPEAELPSVRAFITAHAQSPTELAA